MVRFWSVRMLLVALVLGACPLMPGVRADEATHRSLVQRAGQELRAAERLYYAGDSGAARVARRAQLLLEQADQQRAGDAETALLGIQASVFAGDREGARLWMSRYVSRSPYRERDPQMVFLKTRVTFDPLRSDPRFDDLLRRIGFPEE